jgi:hypothetical protein
MMSAGAALMETVVVTLSTMEGTGWECMYPSRNRGAGGSQPPIISIGGPISPQLVMRH